MINYSKKKKDTKRDFFKKKILKPLLALILVLLFLALGNFALNKFAFRAYDMKAYIGSDRYETGNLVNQGLWKDADTAIIINTNFLHDASSAVPYAFSKNMPVYFTEIHKIESSVVEDLKARKIKKAILAGGITSIDNGVERALNRNGISTERIVAKRGTELSMKFAQLMNDDKKVKAVALIADEKMNIPNGVSFVPIASKERIPIIVLREKDRSMVVDFIRDLGVDKVYVIGNSTSFTSSTIKLFPNAEIISGKDRFEVNKNIIKKFFKAGDTDKIYITKGGVSENENDLKVGEFINSFYVANKAALSNSPILLSKEDYLTVKEEKLIDNLKITKLEQVGFKLKRRSILNPERLRIVSALSLMIISIGLVVKAIYRED